MMEHAYVAAGRALSTPQFWILSLTALGSAGGGAWWVFLPLSVAGLLIAALPRLVDLRAKAIETSQKAQWRHSFGQVVGNSLQAAVIAFLAGQLFSISLR